MMGELDEVDSVALAVVGVDFLAALQIVQTHAEVLAPRHQVLAIVADIYRVDFLFEVLEDKGGLERLDDVVCEGDRVAIVLLVRALRRHRDSG